LALAFYTVAWLSGEWSLGYLMGKENVSNSESQAILILRASVE
jgi:hypothetical protein